MNVLKMSFILGCENNRDKNAAPPEELLSANEIQSCIEEGDLSVVEIKIAKHNVNDKMFYLNCKSPLAIAVTYGKIAIMNYLKDIGADLK